jgi:hypothetical protein
MMGKPLLVMVFMTGAALAAASSAFSAGAGLLPAEQKQGSIAYLTGGIGVDEAKAMERAAKDYPLTLEFLVKAQPRAEFTSDVKVVVTDHAGKVVLDTVSKGPFLLVRLPSGNYIVKAEQGGETKTHRVRVAQNSAKRVIFEWNRAVAAAERQNG